MTVYLGDRLTARQAEVLRLYILGMKSVGVQAQRLGIHASGVVQHWLDIYSKLGVGNKEEAVQIAVREGDLILPREELKKSVSADVPVNHEKEICRFIRDYWLTHQRQYASFADVLAAFTVSYDGVTEILQKLDREGWIEILQESGREVYRPLAAP